MEKHFRHKIQQLKGQKKINSVRQASCQVIYIPTVERGKPPSLYMQGNYSEPKSF